MRKKTILLISVFMFLCLFTAADKPAGYDKYWPEWRGPLTTGIAPFGNPPSEWSESKNVKWKIKLPGKGHASPIVWEDKIFILSAAETEKAGKEPGIKKEVPQKKRSRGMPSVRTNNIHKFIIQAIDRKNGKVLWEKTAVEELPEEGTHQFGSWASNSPVTDGQNIFAYFGSRGLFSFDMNGTLKWKRDFGQMSKRMNFGEGSSPALYKDKIVVNWDHEGESFLYVLSKKNGEEIWKVARDERTTWATPYILEVKGKPQIIISGTKKIRSYDLSSGNLIWECGGMTANVIPHPVFSDGILFVMSGFRGNALLAIRVADAKGDITDSDVIVWSHDKDTPYTPSPLLVNNRLYFLKSNNGVLSCFNASTGESLYSSQRLEGIGNIFTSPVGAAGKIFIVGEKGLTYVVKEGPKFEILAKNTLDDNFCSSPAIVGNSIYLRGYKHLYCIEEK